MEFWQIKLQNKVSISDIEAEGALSDLDRITKLGIQSTRNTKSGRGEFVDFYLRRIV
jgi:hypothetical protein